LRLERRIGAMATEKKKTTLKDKGPEEPLDSDLFAAEDPARDPDEVPAALTSGERPPDDELFAGDEELYKLLADSGQSTRRQRASVLMQSSLVRFRDKRFATTEKVLIAGIVVIAAVVVYALLRSPPQGIIAATELAQPGTSSQETAPPTAPTAPSGSAPATDSGQKIQQTPAVQVLTPASGLPEEQPLSLRAAETLYFRKDYEKASAVYNQLGQGLPDGEAEELIRDFLGLRMAMCRLGTGATDQAHRMFAELRKSRSPLLKVLANYHLGRLEVQKEQYLKARMRAYQAISLIQAIDTKSGWALSLRRNCHLLAAESVTSNVLSLCDADKNLPEDIWAGTNTKGVCEETDPFVGVNEAKLKSLLASGLEQLRRGLLEPKIRKREHAGGPVRWSVVCDGAAIEELLARFAANAGLEIRWASGGTPGTGQTEPIARTRPVSLYMQATTTPQLVTAAAGSVGLLAQPGDNRTVDICDPAGYCSLSEHVGLLSREAISLWQKFLLTFHDDTHVANAHFATGLLHAQGNNVTDAIAEYKLVANRFPQTPLAPLALLHSSKLKTSLHDFLGARDDLKQLVEQYPDSGLYAQACLYLADATSSAGLLKEGGDLYKKVHNLCFCAESQVTAALGAGRCYFREADYEGAAKWLSRYIALVKDGTNSELYSAYLLLGKALFATGKPAEACQALQCALKGDLTKEERTEAISMFAQVRVKQGRLVEALDILETVRSWDTSPKEYVEILLLKAKVLRTMGLAEKAVAGLGEQAGYVTDQRLKAKVSLELSRCLVAKGDLEGACRDLTEVLTYAEPGLQAHEISIELADVCLRLGRCGQTVSVCLHLLGDEPCQEIKRQALEILATAYRRQKDYDKAALALLGRWEKSESSNKNAVAAGQSFGKAL